VKKAAIVLFFAVSFLLSQHSLLLAFDPYQTPPKETWGQSLTKSIHQLEFFVVNFKVSSIRMPHLALGSYKKVLAAQTSNLQSLSLGQRISQFFSKLGSSLSSPLPVGLPTPTPDLAQRVQTLELSLAQLKGLSGTQKTVVQQTGLTPQVSSIVITSLPANTTFISLLGNTVIDSLGDVYPSSGALSSNSKPSLGISGNRYYGIYANNFTVPTGGLGSGFVKSDSGGTLSVTSQVGLTSDVSGTLPIGSGGTGSTVAPTDGQLLIGNSATSGFSLATLTQGSNVTITNGNGTITIASTGGGGSSAFSSITGGTNTSAAMVIGSGASLSTTGTGVISSPTISGTITGSGSPTITSFGAINGLTLASASDGFTVAGGTTGRTLTVTGADITIGSTIRPTTAGTALIVQSTDNGAGASGTHTVSTGTGTTSTGAISIITGNASGGTAGNVVIDVGTSTSGTPTLAIGTSTNTLAKLITIGGSNGTGNITLGSSSGTQTVLIGNGAGVSSVSIGAVTTAGSTVNIASANTATGITDTINIGTGNTVGTGIKAIHIGDGTPAGTNTITIGSLANTANTTTIQGGNGTSAIALTPQTTGTIVIGASAGTGTITLGSSSGTQTILIGNGAGVSSVNVGNTTTAGSTVSIAGANTATGITDTINIGTGNTVGTGIKAIHIGDGTPAGTNTVTIGSVANTANVTNIQGGNGATAINLTPQTTGQIVIGAGAGTGSITLGSSSGTQTILIGNGAGVSSVNIGNTTTAGSTVSIAGANTATGITDTINIGTGNTVGTGIKQVHIADGTPAGTNTVTIGSLANTANVTNVQGGNGATAINLTPQTTGQIVIGAGAGTGNITLGSSSGTQTIRIGNGAGVSSVSIGNTTTAGSTVSLAGANTATGITDTINIGTGNTVGTGIKSIHIGDGTPAGTNTVVIGSNANTANTTTIQGGNGTAAIALTPQTTGTTVIGAAAGTGNITLGSSSGTQTILIGDGAGVSTVRIGNTTTAGSTVSVAGANTATGITDTVNIGTGNTVGTGIKSIHIGDGTPAGTNTVVIGSNANTANTTTLQGGNGAAAIALTPQTTGTIVVGAGAGTGNITLGSSSGTQTVLIGSGAGVSSVSVGNVTTAGSTVSIAGAATATGITDTVNIGTGNTVGTGIKSIHIGDGTPAGTNTVVIGSVANTANTTTIQGGNGTAAIALTPQTTGTIVIGASGGTGNITLGSSSGTQTILIGNGAGVSSVSIGNVTTAGSTVNIAGAATATGITDTINIGTGNPAGTGTKTIHIGDGTPAGGNTITIGSTAGTSATSIQSGTGNIVLAPTGATSIIKNNTVNSVVLANAALSTSATVGFTYIPTSAGAPTGVPATQTGTVALEYDTTNNKMMVYNAAWKGGTAPGVWSDFAEWAPAAGAGIGDTVVITNQPNPTADATAPFMLARSGSSYSPNIVGVVSKYAEEANEAWGYKKSPDYHAVALVGRVPVNVSTENGTIAAGDYLTSSSAPGVAMKATHAGYTLGKATQSYSGDGVGQIVAFIQAGYIDPSQFQLTLTPSSSVVPVASDSSGLTVLGPAEFKSESIFDKLVTFLANVIFKGDVFFFGRATFNKDTAGLAVVKQGADSVNVTFDREYAQMPYTNATPTMLAGNDGATQSILNGTIRYVVQNLSTKGFTIKLNQGAPTDLSFSWSAIATNGTVPSVSGAATTAPEPSVAPASSEPTPVSSNTPEPLVSPTPAVPVLTSPTPSLVPVSTSTATPLGTSVPLATPSVTSTPVTSATPVASPTP
jgi:hypothetical protein